MITSHSAISLDAAMAALRLVAYAIALGGVMWALWKTSGDK